MPEESHPFGSQQQRSFWENRVEQWLKSGLSQAAYCRRHQLKPHQFYYWRRRVQALQDQVSFLPVEFTGPQVQNHPAIRIHTPNGFTIEIEDHNTAVPIETLVATVAGL